MALTNTELFGASGFKATASVAATGTDFIVVPPAALANDPLGVVAWILEQLLQAQAADTSAPTVIRRVATGTDTNITYTYYVTLTAPMTALADAVEANIIDSFSA